MKQLKIKITLLEEVLGMSPADENVYRNYIASKSPDATTIEDEVAALGVDEVAENKMTVFPHNEDREPYMYDYQIKGFFKDAAGMLKRVSGTQSAKLKAYKKIIDGLIFVSPRQIQFDDIIDIGVCERPLRTSGPSGERVALASSETVTAGSTLTFTVTTLEDDLVPAIKEWLDYGKLRGLGQWRNSGKGKFTYEILEEK